MKKLVTIDGKEFEMELTPEQIALIDGPMKRLFDWHNTTEEAFNKLYENIPAKIKAIALEAMIAEMYRNNVEVDWNNSGQYKWVLWFNLSKDVSLNCVGYYHSQSCHIPPFLCFLSEADAKDAWKNYSDVYKISRQP